VHNNLYVYDYEFDYSVIRKLIPFGISSTGFIIGMYCYHSCGYTINSFSYTYNEAYKFLMSNLYLDTIYNKYIMYYGFTMSYDIYHILK